MCKFCENIRTETDYKATNPYIVYGNYCRNEKPMFYIEIPTDDGIDYSVDNINFCPICGRKLSED